MVTDGWTSDFVQNGFGHFAGLIDEAVIAAARRKIDEDLAANYDPARKAEYDARSFCPGILGKPEIMNLLGHTEVRQRISTLLEMKELRSGGQGQVALRRAHNTEAQEPPHPHIDGIPYPLNGVVGDEISPFSLLVGVFLSEVQTQFAGNFTVWPGSHLVLERYFRERGPQATREGMPSAPIGEPKQLLCSPGDVVLCHYQLAHAAAVNTSDNDRYAVFFRLTPRDLDSTQPGYREAAWLHLTHIWTGWKVQNAAA